MWETTKGKPNISNMINKPPTPPDRAKTVRHNKRTHFEHFNDNDDQHANQNDASKANSNFTRVEIMAQQPPKALPPPKPPPPPP